LIWAGDADWICNWYANFDAANAVDYEGHDEFNGKSMEPFEVDGVKKGEFKNVDNLSFLRVYDGGHEVPWYRECLRASFSAVGAVANSGCRARSGATGVQADHAEKGSLLYVVDVLSRVEYSSCTYRLRVHGSVLRFSGDRRWITH